MIETLQELLDRSRRLVVLTGAGCSTGSGIPDYRGPDGAWTRREPMRYQAYVRSEAARRRYWARAYAGWAAFSAARPNAAHRAIARWEADGRIDHLVTQNVDGLHRAAGSRRVVDLHGDLSVVRCLDCGERTPREDLQDRMRAANPDWLERTDRPAPDGDADLESARFDRFVVPPCTRCGGVLKPDVIFFGESVPPDRVARAMRRVEEADALLVVGSSLMVWSGFRFAKAAAGRGVPLAIVNRGATRADDLAAVKVDDDCGRVLSAVRLPARTASMNPTTSTGVSPSS